MIVACIVYPGMTLLDLVGPLQVLRTAGAARGWTVHTVGAGTSPVETDAGLDVAATATFDDVPEPDVVVVPGGGAPTFRAMDDRTLLAYLAGSGRNGATLTSVCTGSLLLGAAGLLEGRPATTHWAFLDALPVFGATPVGERWVDGGHDPRIITAAGVSAGIDMALHLVAELADEATARAVQFGIEYDPQPPQGPLDWAAAPREPWRQIRHRMLADGLGASSPWRARLLG
ncbi:DJ-1/PfpI family protein [Pseudonocardia sp. HH130630-07]|uniref:DJ-1/PfpI family protein n=1 Tax=Pseudonocardia sp. HH130630-07 TaxID=1690815 RepID=UPI0008150606|nr:DJ-1/PfpI family protein [Pseudonocardia sp. HH130630-07]ANY08920.1 thiamine biosynthesis protein ThiJ [Pseudonocardia sp. HH130630-07]